MNRKKVSDPTSTSTSTRSTSSPPTSHSTSDATSSSPTSHSTSDATSSSSSLSKRSNLNVLVGCTGSVASVKVPILVEQLLEGSFFPKQLKINVKLIATNHSFHFFKREDINDECMIYTDEDEWTTWQKMGDPVLHIELRKWANVFVIAPLDANTLGKISNGLCDNLVTCVVRAWDSTEKPLIVCPAMNTLMWTHPITKEQLSTLKSRRVVVVPPVAKKLACGDIGVGALAKVEDIVTVTKQHLIYRTDLYATSPSSSKEGAKACTKDAQIKESKSSDAFPSFLPSAFHHQDNNDNVHASLWSSIPAVLFVVANVAFLLYSLYTAYQGQI
eukprot:m.20069 g.20069  ORF g.20069 m.20069 type:complete len:330 (-) comp5212_c0_seq1:703-1692(-)